MQDFFIYLFLSGLEFSQVIKLWDNYENHLKTSYCYTKLILYILPNKSLNDIAVHLCKCVYGISIVYMCNCQLLNKYLYVQLLKIMYKQLCAVIKKLG